MNKILFLLLFSNIALADCTPKNDIKRQADDTFVYTAGCHIQFGEFRLKNRYQEEQISELKKAITFKDLSVDQANIRADMWKNTSYELRENILKMERNRERSNQLYFGLGVISAFGAAWALNQFR
jgi:hypothetical protein